MGKIIGVSMVPLAIKTMPTVFHSGYLISLAREFLSRLTRFNTLPASELNLLYFLGDVLDIVEAVEKACQEPTLLDALSWICVWESERVVRQAKKELRDADGKGWDTCFKFCLGRVIEKYNQSLDAGGKKPPQVS